MSRLLLQHRSPPSSEEITIPYILFKTCSFDVKHTSVEFYLCRFTFIYYVKTSVSCGN